MRFFLINKIIDIDIWKIEEGYVYIRKDKILWKKENDLTSKNNLLDIELIDKGGINLKNKKKIENDWKDWWVWKFFLKNEINVKNEIIVEDLGFTEDFFKKINYDCMHYVTEKIEITKSNNKIYIKYSNKDSYKVFRLLKSILYELNGDFIGLNTEVEINDLLDVYYLIKSKELIELTLEEEDFNLIKYLKFYFE